MSASGFENEKLLGMPIRDLGLKIEGTALEPIIDEFRGELARVGIVRLRPHFYLSDEWGVPFETIAIGIPFYLARPELIDIHARRVGHLEGVGRVDLLRYLRHEMGHVVNYAYVLYEDEEWVKHFGSITQPYVEEYRPQAFSRRFVQHLPGWYAQKHPDEDWAETFAVWMTPGHDWRADYADWPEALAKLEYCDRTMQRVNQLDPPVTATELDDDVNQLTRSLEAHYRSTDDTGAEPLPPGIAGALRAIFEDFGAPEDMTTDAQRLPADELLLRMERELVANVFRWTGHFPEPTRRLVRHLAQRAREMQQVYPADREETVTIAITTLVTSLAMNHVFKGSYLI